MTTTVSYEEPSLPHLLTLLSFLFLLQLFRGAAERVLKAGLLGEIAVGVIYGTAGILPVQWEQTFLVVGYLGLVLIVFEGGLDLNPSLFTRALPLATLSALVGVLLPIAFTFALFSAYSYPPLSAFAAGAALASTSLGTTFSILRSQGTEIDLARTRIGSLIVGAALIDDIIALVLLSVIDQLGSGSTTSLGWTIGRPLLASAGLALVGPALAFFVARPLFRRYLERRVGLWGRNSQLGIGVFVLSAFLAVSAYAGTTMLLGSFLAGVFLYALPSPNSPVDFKVTYEDLVGPLQKYIFCPLFFASIGFSIPFTSLWTARIVWRGILYALLMALGKVLVGVCPFVADCWRQDDNEVDEQSTGSEGVHSEGTKERCPSKSWVWPDRGTFVPASLLGTALVARGEIGILVLQVAFNSPGNVLQEEPYLVAIWAVALCTIVSPVVFGVMVKRIGKEVGEGRWGMVS